MFDFESTSPFGWLVFGCAVIMGIATLASLVLALRTRDELTRTVVSDMVFYGMLCMYLGRTTVTPSPLSWDIALIAAVAAGVLPTFSMARIISKGRR